MPLQSPTRGVTTWAAPAVVATQRGVAAPPRGRRPRREGTRDLAALSVGKFRGHSRWEAWNDDRAVQSGMVRVPGMAVDGRRRGRGTVGDPSDAGRPARPPARSSPCLRAPHRLSPRHARLVRSGARYWLVLAHADRDRPG